jgi:Ca2+-transporting ATPase
MVIGTLFVFFHALEDGVEEQRYATTLAFTTFVMFQMFNALNCRSATQSVMAIGFFRYFSILY